MAKKGRGGGGPAAGVPMSVSFSLLLPSPPAPSPPPPSGYLVAAVAFDRPDLGAGAPGKHRARIVAEDRMRHRQVEIGRRHRAAAGLAEAPGGRGVGARDGLDH